MKSISTCLWFDNQAEEATKFYTSIFKNSKTMTTVRYGKAGAAISGQKEGAVMTVSFQLENAEIMALNGGPVFKFSPSLSLFVQCTDEQDIKDKWSKLSAGGQVRMGLDKYPWAEMYGWTADKFGVDWQLILSTKKPKISQAFLFTDKLFGKGEEAIQFYMSIFPDSKIESMTKDEKTKTVMHCAFSLSGNDMVLMEGTGKHGHEFTNATSLVINCKDQKEIDHYWDRLSEGGKIEECGWLKDKYGVSWQVVPEQMEQYMANPEKAEKVMNEVYKMKKLDLEKIKAAAR